MLQKAPDAIRNPITMGCELDALYFYHDGIEHDDVDYIMEALPITKRKEEVRGPSRANCEFLRLDLLIFPPVQKSKQMALTYHYTSP